MKDKAPKERTETIRQSIMDLLENRELPVGVISRECRISEREVCDHLEHIVQSGRLVIVPAECLKCGFIFEMRKKIKKPGKCPACKNTYIDEPVFSLRPA